MSTQIQSHIINDQHYVIQLPLSTRYNSPQERADSKPQQQNNIANESLHLPQLNQDNKISLLRDYPMTSRQDKYKPDFQQLYKTSTDSLSLYPGQSTQITEEDIILDPLLSKINKRNPFKSTSKNMIAQKKHIINASFNRTSYATADQIEEQTIYQNIGQQDNLQNSKSVLFDSLTSQSDFKINSKLLEIWLNETMLTAEHQINNEYGLKSSTIKAEKKKPLNRFNVDRHTLTNAGISATNIDRIYRSLFVYSVGFYEMLKQAMVGCKNKPAFISNFWKVYSILLEYCCKHDYKMQICEITQRHQEEISQLEVDIDLKCGQFMEKEGQLKQNIHNLMAKIEEVDKERHFEIIRRQQLLKEHEQQNRNYEDEVNLRKRYEMKINELFTFHREVETRYKRAVEEIIKIDFLKEEASQKVSIYTRELERLKKENQNSQTILESKAQDVEYWKREAELYKSRCQDHQESVIEYKTQLRLKNMNIGELQQKESETKEHLEIANQKNSLILNEIINLKEINQNETIVKQRYLDQSKRNELHVIDLMNSHKECVGKIVGLGVFNKHLVERALLDRAELQYKSDQLQALDQSHFSASNQLKQLQELYESLKKDHNNAVDRLSTAQKEKQRLDQEVHDAKVRQLEQQNKMADKDRLTDKYKKDCERLAIRLNSLEVAYDNLEIVKAAAIEKSQIEYKEIDQKVQSLELMLITSKQNRAGLVQKWEDEQKMRNETEHELNKLKLQLEDKYIECQRLQSNIKNDQKKDDKWQKQIEELYKKIDFYVQKKELLEKELNTAQELLRLTESSQNQYKLQIAKLEKELQELKISEEEYSKEVVEQADQIRQSNLIKIDLEEFNDMLTTKIIQLQMQKDKERANYKEQLTEKEMIIQVQCEQIRHFREAKTMEQEVQVDIKPETSSVNIQVDFQEVQQENNNQQDNADMTLLAPYVIVNENQDNKQSAESVFQQYSVQQKDSKKDLIIKNNNYITRYEEQFSRNKNLIGKAYHHFSMPTIGLDTSFAASGLLIPNQLFLQQQQREKSTSPRSIFDNMSNQQLNSQLEKINTPDNNNETEKDTNITALSNVPRLLKLNKVSSKFDRQTAKMLQGKCSLKELLKSAAARPNNIK